MDGGDLSRCGCGCGPSAPGPRSCLNRLGISIVCRMSMLNAEAGSLPKPKGRFGEICQGVWLRRWDEGDKDSSQSDISGELMSCTAMGAGVPREAGFWKLCISISARRFNRSLRINTVLPTILLVTFTTFLSFFIKLPQSSPLAQCLSQEF